MLEQYNFLEKLKHGNEVADLIQDKIPAFAPFIAPKDSKVWAIEKITSLDLTIHEIGHPIELVERDKALRLGLENYGWDRSKVGQFTDNTRRTEAKVFALQYLLEEYLTGAQMNHILCINNASYFITFRSDFTTETGKKWILEAMEFYRPTIGQRLEDASEIIAAICRK